MKVQFVSRMLRNARRWIGCLPLLAAGLMGGPLRAQPIAEGGSPLYLIAVRESILGLKGKKTTPAQAAPVQSRSRTAAQRGQTNRTAITPEFLRRYYYCTNCHAWHPRPTPLPTPGSATNHAPRPRAPTPPVRSASRTPSRPPPAAQPSSGRSGGAPGAQRGQSPAH